jgi:hypothetical protein
MSDNTPDRRSRNAVHRVLEAVDGVIKAAEELKKANAALSLEASRPPLRIVPADPKRGEGGRGQ